MPGDLRLGLRNPFRIAFDPNAAGTRFFINDVGQNTWEEVDLGQAGADYGWNVREGHCARLHDRLRAPPAGMTNPIYDYSHAGDCDAITGGAFVPDGIWPSAYEGSYLFGDFTCGKIMKLDASGPGFVASDFVTNLGFQSAVVMAFGPHGSTRALYYTTYDGGGEIHRVAFTGTINRNPVAVAPPAPRRAGCPSRWRSTEEAAATPTATRSATTGISATGRLTRRRQPPTTPTPPPPLVPRG